MTRNLLRDAILEALGVALPSASPMALDIAREASKAKTSLEANMSCVARIPIAAGSGRHRVAFQLLRASMDFGRALLFLLEAHLRWPLRWCGTGISSSRIGSHEALTLSLRSNQTKR